MLARSSRLDERESTSFAMETTPAVRTIRARLYRDALTGAVAAAAATATTATAAVGVAKTLREVEDDADVDNASDSEVEFTAAEERFPIRTRCDIVLAAADRGGGTRERATTTATVTATATKTVTPSPLQRRLPHAHPLSPLLRSPARLMGCALPFTYAQVVLMQQLLRMARCARASRAARLS